MGIIKTAMVSGVGLYAVKQIANAANNRQSNQQSSYSQRDYQHDERNVARDRQSNSSTHQRAQDQQQQQQHMYLANDTEWTPLPPSYHENSFYARERPRDSYTPLRRQSPVPVGFIEPLDSTQQGWYLDDRHNEDQIPPFSTQSRSHLPALAQQAMRFYKQPGSGVGGKKDKKNDGMEMLTSFFK